MITTATFLAFVVCACAGLGAMAWREHRDVLRRRGGLLDEAARLFKDSRITLAPDKFPVLDGRHAGRRIRVELVPDTLVFRRLPQLWLKLTLAEAAERRRPSIGALSRPTGAEFYSLVHDLPERITPPDRDDEPLLMRADGSPARREIERASALFRTLFRDPALKEAVITPRGVRLVRQLAEGDRGAHLLLRQVRFPMESVPPHIVRDAVADMEALSEALAEEAAAPALLRA